MIIAVFCLYELNLIYNYITVDRRSRTRKCPTTGRSAARDRGHARSQAQRRAARRRASRAPPVAVAVAPEAVRRPSPVHVLAAGRLLAPAPALGPAAAPRPSPAAVLRPSPALVHGRIADRHATRNLLLSRAPGRAVVHRRSRAPGLAVVRRTIPWGLPPKATRDRGVVHRTTPILQRSRAASPRRPTLRTWRERATPLLPATAPGLLLVSIGLFCSTLPSRQ